MKPITNSLKTCGTCWYRHPQTLLDTNNDYQEWAGCGTHPEFVVTKFDQANHRILEARPLLSSDEACEQYFTLQEGYELMARDQAAFEAKRRLNDAKGRFIVIDGGMTAANRRCANSVSFREDPDIEDPESKCWNPVSFVKHPGTLDPVRSARSSTDCCQYHRTLKEDAAQTADTDAHRDELMAQIGKQAADQELSNMKPSSEFMAAMEVARRLAITLGEIHPDTMAAMMMAVELAPPDAQEVFYSSMRSSGAMPEASGYADDGKPVFSLESVAAKFGVSDQEVQQVMNQILEARDELGLSAVMVSPARIHRKH